MNKKVWLITGAGRGMGADIARAALAAGHAVVATGRNSDAVSKELGESADLLTVALDVTSRSAAEAASRAAVDRFRRIDVLVNNAASFYAGYFEELTPEQFERQLSVSLIGPMNVTRAVLPVMRNSARVTSSRSPRRLASLPASTSCPPTPRRSSASRAGWNRCRPRSRRSAFSPPSSTLDPFVRNSSRSNRRSMPSRPSPTTTSGESRWSSTGNHRTVGNPGDPAKLARALVTIASEQTPPRRFLAGADAIATAEQKIADLRAQLEAYRELSTALAFD